MKNMKISSLCKNKDSWYPAHLWLRNIYRFWFMHALLFSSPGPRQ